MKKLFLVALALMLISSVSFAQGAKDTPSPAKEIDQGVKGVSEFVGKVLTVTVADPANGIKEGTIKVADDMGNPVSYTVNSAVKIVDTSLKAVTLGQLKEGDTVKIKAEKTTYGKDEAKSINVI